MEETLVRLKERTGIALEEYQQDTGAQWLLFPEFIAEIVGWLEEYESTE